MMETKYKIEIPKPCFESWDKMTPNESGRFCGSCMKNVVDFTNLSDAEIQNYLLEHEGKKVCGRFNQMQLDAITIQVPQQILFSQIQFKKIFLLALLLSMGTTLLSCSDKNGEKKRIDKVEIVEDSMTHPVTTMGLPIPPDPSKQDPESLPNTETDTVTSIAPTIIGKAKLAPKNQSQSKKITEPIVLTGAVIVSEKDSLKKQEK